MLVRPARPSDVSQITDIVNMYTTDSVTTLRLELLGEEAIRLSFESVREQGLPYLVVVEEEIVQGYAYASAYRQPSHMGYAPTVEITVFAHPSSKGKGVGTLMMDTLVSILRKPADFPEYIEPGRIRAPPVTEVLAVMSVDTEGPGGGYGLRDFYKQWGFVQVGELKNVGYKFGRRIDTLFLQLSLNTLQ